MLTLKSTYFCISKKQINENRIRRCNAYLMLANLNPCLTKF